MEWTVTLVYELADLVHSFKNPSSTEVTVKQGPTWLGELSVEARMFSDFSSFTWLSVVDVSVPGVGLGCGPAHWSLLGTCSVCRRDLNSASFCSIDINLQRQIYTISWITASNTTQSKLPSQLHPDTGVDNVQCNDAHYHSLWLPVKIHFGKTSLYS